MRFNSLLRLTAATTLALSLTGCITPQSYVDPGLHDATWTVVQKPASVHAVNTTIEFYRNGERFTRADKQVRGAVERALSKSGVFALQGQGAPASLTIKVDNIADIGEAMKKGFGTGLTFGAKGTTVTDGYRITIVYNDGNGTIEKKYEHALHTTIGKTKPPTNAAPTTPVQAFDQVIEDAVIHFIRDMQGEGKLVLQTRDRTLRQG